MYNKLVCDVLEEEEDTSRGKINSSVTNHSFIFDPKPYAAENDETILDQTSVNDTTLMNSTFYKKKGIFGDRDSSLNTTSQVRTRRTQA